jgi:hypothetical protein
MSVKFILLDVDKVQGRGANFNGLNDRFQDITICALPAASIVTKAMVFD